MVGRISFLLAIVFCCSISVAEEAVEIPLSEVWGMNMPGTKDLSATTDKSSVGSATPKHLVIPQHKLLQKPPEAEAMRGMAVYGTGRRALTFASIGLATRNPDVCSPLYSTEEISIAFFSYPCNYHIYLDHVERRGNVIETRYRCVPHYTAEVTVHIALIPLGKLPAGDYRVEITQAPLDQKYVDAGFAPLSTEAAQKVVSQPFSFNVEDPPTPETVPSENAITIPLDQIWAYRMPGTRDVRSLVDGEQVLQPIGMRVGGPSSFMSTNGKRIAGSGFAVLGTGKEALIATHEKLPEGRKVRDEFPIGSEVSLVFFSHPFGYFVHIKQVVRNGNSIMILYRFVPHETRGRSSHFALIPMGNLPAGEYQVEMIRLPMKNQTIAEGFRPVTKEKERQVVCKNFTFSVVSTE